MTNKDTAIQTNRVPIPGVGAFYAGAASGGTLDGL